MANIRERSGRYHVEIRRKNFQSMCATFSCEEDALLWARYKEDLLDQINSFEPPKNELITLDAAIDMKLQQLTDEQATKKTIQDIVNLKTILKDHLHKSLHECDESFFREFFASLLNTKVKRGGIRGEKSLGRTNTISPATILSRINRLCSVFSNLIQSGIANYNPVYPVYQHYKKVLANGSSKDKDFEESSGNVFQDLEIPDAANIFNEARRKFKNNLKKQT